MDSHRLEIERAVPGDGAALAALVNSAYRGDSSRKGWTTEADLLDGVRVTPDYLEREIADPEKAILKGRLRREGEWVACVSLARFRDARGTGGYLGMLTVSPTLQAGGIGKELVAACEEFARREWAASRMQLTVIPLRAELIAWYERRGYRATGESRPFPYDQPGFGTAKRPDLSLAVFEKRL